MVEAPMRVMKLNRLELRNFKGIKALKLDIGGQDMSIYGANATGKTTLYDAWLWLLFGKDSGNRADFQVKTLDERGEAIPQIEHEVYAEVDTGERRVILKKILTEDWKKKRGSATSVFTGHTVTYTIDGVPVTETNYKAFVGGLVGSESAFRMLTNPRHFPEALHWQERRDILMAMAGEIPDSDVVARDKELALLKIPQGRTLAEHKLVLKNRLTEINKGLKDLPARMDEQERAKPVMVNAGLNAADIAAQRDALRTTLRKKLAEQTRLEQGGGVAEKTKQLRELEGQALDMETAWRRKLVADMDAANLTLTKAQTEEDGLKASIAKVKQAIQDNASQVAKCREALVPLREEWEAEKHKEFTFDQPDRCPTCHQPLPKEAQEAALAEALAICNQDKAHILERIEEAAATVQERMKELEADTARQQVGLKAIEERLAKVDGLITTTQNHVTSLEAGSQDYKADPAYAKLQTRILTVKDEITKLEAGQVGETSTKLAQEISSLGSQADSLDTTLEQMAQRKRCDARIEELGEQQKQLASEYDKLEAELYLAEKFTRSKVELVQDRVNSLFAIARFQMFRVLVNGGLEDCCEVLYHGTPYTGNLSNSERINVGLDIIGALAVHYRMAAPIFVDNAEAVLALGLTQGQQIRLYVSGEDKSLRVEGGSK